MRPKKNSDDVILGGKQLAVLQVISLLHDEAYGGGIYARLSEDDEHTALPQIYSILEKLEKKGMVTFDFSAPKPTRGGRRRKVYKLTGKGETVRRQSLVENPRLGQGDGWVFSGLGEKR